jgi:hypothetical protein
MCPDTAETSGLANALTQARAPFFYWRIEPVTRSRTEDLLDHLRLDLRGRHVVDLGPGNGASLRVFRERGASTRFVERNPLLYVACRVRGFEGHLADFTLDPPPVRDIVYARGSIHASSFPDSAALSDWLDRLEANIHIVCPWLPKDPPSWFTRVLDSRFERVAVLGYQTPVYPVTWVTRLG